LIFNRCDRGFKTCALTAKRLLVSNLYSESMRSYREAVLIAYIARFFAERVRLLRVGEEENKRNSGPFFKSQISARMSVHLLNP